MFQRCSYCLNRLYIYCLAVRNSDDRVYHSKCLNEYKIKVRNTMTVHKAIYK